MYRASLLHNKPSINRVPSVETTSCRALSVMVRTFAPLALSSRLRVVVPCYCGRARFTRQLGWNVKCRETQAKRRKNYAVDGNYKAQKARMDGRYAFRSVTEFIVTEFTAICG
jgi:hypothetical protein